jgi:lipopolysaccharide/colanic/teichoic acid biosynthesis glycosyltransferase
MRDFIERTASSDLVTCQKALQQSVSAGELMLHASREMIGATAYSDSDTPVLGVQPPVNRYRESKANPAVRTLDIVGAALLLAFTMPLMVVIALLVKLQDGGSVIFAHRRIGQGGRMFPCLKFRTMVPDASQRLANLLATDSAARAEWARDHKLRKDPRITALGNFLRRSSLDELPQLINVLRGEMSLVGPRPVVLEEAPRYGRWLRYYCAVQPGITGLWQVSGRNDISYRRRVACDVLYARRQSLFLNISIAFRTIPAVLKQKGSC